jgi:hypothetical protein
MAMIGVALALLLFAPPPTGKSARCDAGLSAGDEAAVRAVIEKYRRSWLEGDAEGVMATLGSDAVLLPAHGAAPVVGGDAIRRYWWPAGAPPTTITVLDISR